MKATRAAVRSALVGIVIALPALGLVACGESPAADPERPSELVFTKPDGTTFTLRPEALACRPSEYDDDVQVVGIEDYERPDYLVVEVVPADVAGGATFDLPLTAGDMQDGPANAFVFYGSKDFEVSTSQEESSGTLEVASASCDPVSLELTIDATLASEFGGESLDVRGHLDLTGTSE